MLLSLPFSYKTDITYVDAVNLSCGLYTSGVTDLRSY
jgi:hypothetical protein